MKPFAERNPYVIGVVGLCVALVASWVSLNYQKLPFFNTGKTYSAYFAEAGGLVPGNPVRVSGVDVGKVSSVELDGPRVLVKFKVGNDVRLGERAEAAIETETLLAAKLLNIRVRGDGQLAGAIPMERTTSPYHLPDALGDLSTTISGLDTDQLSNSFAVLADTFSKTTPDLKAAVEGVGRFSQTLNERDTELRKLLENANKATKVLAERSAGVVSLVVNTNALLAQLKTQSDALDQISHNISALAKQIKGFIADNRASLKPALEKLNGVLALVDNRKAEVQASVQGLNQYALSLGEVVSSGPFFNAYLANLVPGQFVQPFIDAAFSDLGLDPATLLPSELADAQTGQQATPPLPSPFPRTGQGGEPRLTVPDAISGNPGDQPCPGALGPTSPGPGCYPYREPPPAPPAGGPPPGPPAPDLRPIEPVPGESAAEEGPQ